MVIYVKPSATFQHDRVHLTADGIAWCRCGREERIISVFYGARIFRTLELQVDNRPEGDSLTCNTRWHSIPQCSLPPLGLQFAPPGVQE
jgi:hypothetical protein